jgi:hypothetical protein
MPVPAPVTSAVRPSIRNSALIWISRGFIHPAHATINHCFSRSPLGTTAAADQLAFLKEE